MKVVTAGGGTLIRYDCRCHTWRLIWLPTVGLSWSLREGIPRKSTVYLKCLPCRRRESLFKRFRGGIFTVPSLHPLSAPKLRVFSFADDVGLDHVLRNGLRSSYIYANRMALRFKFNIVWRSLLLTSTRREAGAGCLKLVLLWWIWMVVLA